MTGTKKAKHRKTPMKTFDGLIDVPRDVPGDLVKCEVCGQIGYVDRESHTKLKDSKRPVICIRCKQEKKSK